MSEKTESDKVERRISKPVRDHLDMINRHFGSGQHLNSDYINAFSDITSIWLEQLESGQRPKFRTLLAYEDYFRDFFAKKKCRLISSVN